MFCPDPSKSTNEPYPIGYLEALEDCKALAVNLLQKALTGEDASDSFTLNQRNGDDNAEND